MGILAFCSPAANLLVSSVERGTILVAGATLAFRCLPRLSAATRSALWMMLLLLVLVSPVISWPQPKPTAGAAAGVMFASAGWAVFLVAIWAAMVLLRATQLAASAFELRGIRKRALPIEASAGVQALLRGAARHPELCVCSEVSRPSVAGFFRPKILLPAGLLEELSEAELQHVVLHEIEHLRRRDDWTNLLQRLSLVLVPFHPALLWIDRRLCVERELACDDGVLRRAPGRKAYAASLARLAENSMVRRGMTLALSVLGVWARKPELRKRVERILRVPSGMRPVPTALASTLLLAGMVGGSALLSRSPRLIRFASPAQLAARNDVSVRVPVPSQDVERGAAAPRFQALTVKATLPETVTPSAVTASRPPEARVRHAVEGSLRQRAALRRVAIRQTSAAGADAPYLVYTTWVEEMLPPRMTLAAATTTTTLQPAYAAVPVRGGWLLIQL